MFSFLLGAFIVIMFTVATILFTALKSAKSNPVKSLKSELRLVVEALPFKR